MIIRWVIYRSVLCQKMGIFFSRKLLILQILAAKMAEVFKKRFMTSYARHVTQNEIFSIPLYPPPEYLSNDI